MRKPVRSGEHGVPWIEHRNARCNEVAGVATDHDQIILCRCCRDEEVELTEYMPTLPATFEQEPPAQYDSLTDRERSSIEERAKRVIQPCTNGRAPFGIAELLNAEADFSKRDLGNKQVVLSLRRDESHDGGVWPWFAQL